MRLGNKLIAANVRKLVFSDTYARARERLLRQEFLQQPTLGYGSIVGHFATDGTVVPFIYPGSYEAAVRLAAETGSEAVLTDKDSRDAVVARMRESGPCFGPLEIMPWASGSRDFCARFSLTSSSAQPETPAGGLLCPMPVTACLHRDYGSVQVRLQRRAGAAFRW